MVIIPIKRVEYCTTIQQTMRRYQKGNLTVGIHKSSGTLNLTKSTMDILFWYNTLTFCLKLYFYITIKLSFKRLTLDI